MKLSIFCDELGLDFKEAFPYLRDWGYQYIDLRNRFFDKPFDQLTPDEMKEVKTCADDHGLTVAVLQSSLAKVHLPDQERLNAEADKLEAIIRAADIFGTRHVRSFHYWQPRGDIQHLRGQLAPGTDHLQQVLDRYGPLAERAKAAGLIIGFENCGVDAQEVFTVLDTLNVPGWGLAWDPYNTWSGAERKSDENGYIKRMLARSIMLHVKCAGAVPEFEYELIPYDKILAACQAIGFDGAVSVETHSGDDKVNYSRLTTEAIQRAWPTGAPRTLEEILA